MTQSSAAIFIESNTTPTGKLFLERAKEGGYRLFLLSTDPSRYPALTSISGVESVICDTNNDQALERTIDQIADRHEIALILSSSDYFVERAAQQSARLGLAGPAPEAVAICRDKARLQDVLQKAGVGVPRHAVTLTCACQIRRAIDEVGFPAVVKPVAGTGSLGVRLARSGEELQTAVDAILSVRMDGRGRSITPRALVASYLPGDEYSVEILDGNVIGVTAKYLGNLPYFVEIGHNFPACLSNELKAEIERTALAAILAIGLTRGPAHVELRADGTDVAIIEVNPRLAGGAIPSMIAQATGLDIVQATIRSAAGKAVDLVPSQSRFAALRFIVPCRPGLFAPDITEDRLASEYRLSEVSFYQPFPVQFKPSHDFHDRLGHVIATGESAAHAAWRANGAIGELFKNEENSHA